MLEVTQQKKYIVLEVRAHASVILTHPYATCVAEIQLTQKEKMIPGRKRNPKYDWYIEESTYYNFM